MKYSLVEQGVIQEALSKPFSFDIQPLPGAARLTELAPQRRGTLAPLSETLTQTAPRPGSLVVEAGQFSGRSAAEAVAARFGVRGRDVVFTSGGTEANALAIRGLAAGRRVLVGATEHPAVLAATGPEAEMLPVLADGTLDLAALEAALKRSSPALVAVMAANNETGVLHPIEAIAELCRQHGALLHLDAVQMPARLPFTLGAADSMALSAHKLGGPKGVGALLLRPGLDPAPLLTGGGQESGRRGGTEALPAIAGFAAAIACPMPEGLARLRDAIEAGVKALAPEVIIAGDTAPRLPNTTSLILPGITAETQVIALDLAGAAVSAGAACSSGKVRQSHVLTAMGYGAEAASAIRVSLPWNAPTDTPARFVEAWGGMRERLRARLR
ncbi:MAG: aminotransferase class V-fold PLP-dependent enzyme [Alphaproteobacteria bacterium]|nr:aminotransferase class V-fold PLP-dependent enzyme [Alphaproteobacteria bacterium]